MKIDKITAPIAALYLGQKCDVEWLYTDTINDVLSKGTVWHDRPIHSAHLKRLQDNEILIAPHLRRLESLTEDEAREVYKVYFGKAFPSDYPKPAILWWESHSESNMYSPAVWIYLLQKGFDLFGLIDAGLAKEIVAQ